MKTVSGRHLCRVLERHGWVLRRIRGSHHIYAREGDTAILTVPVHGHRDLRIGILRQLLRDAGLSESDL
ncbi:MAG: type II toxin-antitoxin system HicA family toxin [Thermoanaerobaculia bacterium]|nr:type II toxin-antitoxin system HicA family toxin [Thermoanaerobaculia bacterium]